MTFKQLSLFTGFSLACLIFGVKHIQAITPTPSALTVPNGSFETGSLENWEKGEGLNSADTFVVDSDQWGNPRDGRYYAKVSKDASASGLKHITSNWINIGSNVSGKQYNLSVDIRSHTSSASVSGISIQRYPDYDKPNPWDKTSAYFPALNVTDQWNTYSRILTFPTPSNGNSSTKVRIVLESNNEKWVQPIYYDNIKLEPIDESSCTDDTCPTVEAPEVKLSCTNTSAEITWAKIAGSSNQAYEVGVCEGSSCTSAQLDEGVIGRRMQLDTPQVLFSDSEFFTKGEYYSFAVRQITYSGESISEHGNWGEQTSKLMSGPLGDMDHDCDVDLADYTMYLTALRNPYAPSSIFERMIYFYNQLIANLGKTS